MRTAMLIYFDLLPSLETLSNAEAGKLFKAILRYNVQGVLPEKLGKCEALVFQQLKAQHDRDIKHYEETSQKRREAARTRFGTLDTGESN